MATIDIVLADSEILIREGMKSILKDDERFNVIDEVENSSELRSILVEKQPKVLVLDYALKGHFSTEDVEYIKKNSPETNILAITHDPQKEELFQVLEYGVSSFLLKQCDRNEILSAVHATAKDEKFFCGKVLDIILDKRKSEKVGPCEPTKLTKRETEIVGLIASGEQTKAIAEKLHLSAHTVNTHRKNIMRKLKINNTAELVLYAINTSIIQATVDRGESKTLNH